MTMNLAEAKVRNLQALLDYLNHAHSVKYLFFWGHRKSRDGYITKACFSQWFEAPFEVDGSYYFTAEHYMMAEKARLFGDSAAAAKIVQVEHPGAVKKIGREIQGFDEQVWIQHRFDIVVKGNRAKFSQNPELGNFLLSTENRVLVEASPKDKIWGIGLAEDHPEAEDPYQWQGLNLLGFALMEVRDRLLAGG